MKLLYTTDWHLTDKKPDSRLDTDFLTTQLAKVTEVFEIAEKEKVDIIYHGGDLFDKGRSSLHIINLITPLFKKNTVPFECVVGSHDTIGYNIDSLKYTGLGNLIASGYVRFIQKDSIAAGFNCSTVPRVPKGGGKKIIVAHEMIAPVSLPFTYISMEAVAKENPNSFILCGHYHKPFMKKVGTTFFFNPGPLVRTAIDEIDVKPSVVLLDINSMKVEFRELKSAKSGKEVFAVEAAMKRKIAETEFQKFVESLREKFQEVNVEFIIRELAKIQNVEQEVVDVALSLIRG